MAKGIFKLSGIDEYMEQIQAAGLDILPAAVQAVEAGSDVLLAGMQRRVPKDTHNLEAHLSKEIEIEGDYVFAQVGLVDADAETARYGNAQEYGSVSMPAQPYVRPAMDEDRRRALKAMKDALKGFVDA